jgi:hypothetical protein
MVSGTPARSAGSGVGTVTKVFAKNMYYDKWKSTRKIQEHKRRGLPPRG